jgi:hypothetical protein
MSAQAASVAVPASVNDDHTLQHVHATPLLRRGEISFVALIGVH